MRRAACSPVRTPVPCLVIGPALPMFVLQHPIMAYDMHAPDAQGYVPGVYNYCDRWCERCIFVHRCRVGRVDMDDAAYENEGSDLPASKEERFRRIMDELRNPPTDLATPSDGDDEADELPEALDDAREEDNTDDGTGWSVEEMNAMTQMSPEEETEWERKRAGKRKQVEAHVLMTYGNTYLDLCQVWLETNTEALRTKGIDLSRRDMGVHPLGPAGLLLREAVDAIMWYRTMMAAKLHRALSGLIDYEDERDDPDHCPEIADHNGTAKLCLTMADQCVQAWATVAEQWPEQALETAAPLDLLARIKAQLAIDFPDAHRFVRAGWDAHMGTPKCLQD